MDGAKVGIFEDHKGWCEVLTEILEENGHTVVAIACSMNEARTAIDGLGEGSLDVAVVDGNLNPNTDTGDDGAEITRLLKERLGGIVIIGFSGGNDVEGVDHSVSKNGVPDEEIPAIIAQI